MRVCGMLEQKNDAAEQLFEKGDLQGALRFLSLARSLDPRHPRTVGLVERVESAIKEQQAADAAERRRRTVDQLLRERGGGTPDGRRPAEPQVGARKGHAGAGACP